MVMTVTVARIITMMENVLPFNMYHGCALPTPVLVPSSVPPGTGTSLSPFLMLFLTSTSGVTHRMNTTTGENDRDHFLPVRDIRVASRNRFNVSAIRIIQQNLLINIVIIQTEVLRTSFSLRTRTFPK